MQRKHPILESIAVVVAIVPWTFAASAPTASASAKTYQCQRYRVFNGSSKERREDEAWLLHIRVSSDTIRHLQQNWPPPKLLDAGSLAPCGVARGVEGRFMNAATLRSTGALAYDHHFTNLGVPYSCSWAGPVGYPGQPEDAAEVVCLHRGRYPERIWFSGTLEESD